MRFSNGNIIKFIVAVLLTATLAACRHHDDEPPVTPPPYPTESEDYLIILNINALDDVWTNSDIDNSKEMVRSLRIVMLNDGAVELNQYVIPPGGTDAGVNMADLDYVFTARTVEGTKTFYLFANEESVENVEFFTEDGVSLPSDLPTNLHDYLEKIKPNVDDVEAGENFENIIRSVYFEPDYTPDESGNIYLPYTSYYDPDYTVGINSPSNITSPLQMYLVPVATKFMFRFVNYRPNPVDISNITVLSRNTEDFLFARVNEPDDSKIFEEKEYYWVDWLAKVSEASHESINPPDNVTFNEKYGWIENYNMPSQETVPAVFIDPDADPVETIDAGTPKKTGEEDGEDEGSVEIEPGIQVLGPYYMPESRNMITYTDGPNETKEIQRYGLTLKIHDKSDLPDHGPVFENVAIDNLQALFRNTCVLITVTMRQGKVEVYAEINDWTRKSANGWLVEGNAPSNNPF